MRQFPLVIDHWDLVIHWLLVIGHWSLVIGHWSLVIGHWSLVIGHWSLVIRSASSSSVFMLSVAGIGLALGLRQNRSQPSRMKPCWRMYHWPFSATSSGKTAQMTGLYLKLSPSAMPILCSTQPLLKKTHQPSATRRVCLPTLRQLLR